MLDFYLIKDFTPKTAHGIAEQDYVGGIDINEFESLKDKKIIEEHLDFYKDFRWTYDQVSNKLNDLLLFEKNQTQDHKFKLIDILKKAKDENCGLVAYCD